MQGYWAFPSVTALVENGVTAPMSQYGLLQNIADAPKVAPMQPWARALYIERQRRFLQDDPMYLNCKPPGGPRQFQMTYGVQFVENRERQRIFVLIGSGNSNYRLIYTDGRNQKGQVGGDDDNPCITGGRWANGTATRWSWIRPGSTRTSGSPTAGCPIRISCASLERFTRTDFDTLKYEVTIQDEGAYTRPWSSGSTLRWVADEELPRHICQENRS